MTNVTQLKPFYAPTLADKVERLRTLDRELKRVEKAYNALKTEIISEMGNTDRIVNELGHEIVTYKQDKDSLVFDKDRFKADHSDVYFMYEITKPGSRRFILK